MWNAEFTAVERAAAEPFDLVLLDVMLPRWNGFDLLRDSIAAPRAVVKSC